ncbi:hypothetical protein GA0061093_12942 [Rhodococcus qingshengii]|nr:hypothetical protein GA0061093_12942 [Rhodococcus qingshengii]
MNIQEEIRRTGNPQVTRTDACELVVQSGRMFEFDAGMTFVSAKFTGLKHG